MCFKIIYNMFIFLKFEIFSEAIAELLRSHFLKIAHKVSKSKDKIFCRYVKCIRIFNKFPFQRYIFCWGKFRTSKIIGGGGGCPAPPPSLIMQKYSVYSIGMSDYMAGVLFINKTMLLIRPHNWANLIASVVHAVCGLSDVRCKP